MNNQTNSIVAIQERYKDCNLLLPVATEIQLNPFYKYTVMEVRADIKEGSGDIFKIGSSKVGTIKKTNKTGEEYEVSIYAEVFSPAKPLLMKLASAAGIQFDPNNTYGNFITKNCYKAKAYGAMRMPDGTGKTHCDEKVINLDDEEDRLRLEFMDKSLQGIMDEKASEEAAKMFKGEWFETVNKWKKTVRAYKINDCDREKYITRGVLVNMTLLRKTFAEKAMTGAILRVIRALIGMKGTYSLEELEKPFAIPRVTFSPDYSDPMVRAAMIEQGMNSISNMFGTTSALPSSTPYSGSVDTFNPEEFADNAAFSSDYEETISDDFNIEEKVDLPPKETTSTADNSLYCDMCEALINEKVYEYSTKKFNRPLCFNCQKGA